MRAIPWSRRVEGLDPSKHIINHIGCKPAYLDWFMGLYATMCGVVLFSSFNTLRQYTQSLCDALEFPSCFHEQIKGFFLNSLLVFRCAIASEKASAARETNIFLGYNWLYDNSHQLWPNFCHLVDGIPQFIKEKDPSHVHYHPPAVTLTTWLLGGLTRTSDADVGRGASCLSSWMGLYIASHSFSIGTSACL